MLLSKPQLYRFWTEWNAIVKHRAWSKDEGESQRKLMLRKCGFDSLHDVDRLTGYTAVLKELAILRDDIGGMLMADANARRMLIHNVRELASQITGHPVHVADAYWQAIARDRFNLDFTHAVSPESALHDLSVEQLTQLRNTLENRLTSKRRKGPAVQAKAEDDTVPF